MGLVPPPPPPAPRGYRYPTRSELLDERLRDLDRILARELNEPWRLKAPWFEGLADPAKPEKPKPDHWVKL
jgi:hypothetical protein